MTPGQVAFETFKASVEFYIAPWRFLESEWQAAWDAVANAVSGDLIADNDRLRAALATLKYEVETISNGRQEEVRSDFTSGEANGWTMAACHIGEIVTIALAPPAPAAVSAYRAAIRREAFLEAAKLIQKTTPDPLTDEGWSWHGGRMANVEQLEAMAKREGKGRDEK